MQLASEMQAADIAVDLNQALSDLTGNGPTDNQFCWFHSSLA